MIVTVSDTSPKPSRGHIRAGCDKWKHLQNDFADIADQMGALWGHIGRIEMCSTSSTFANQLQYSHRLLRSDFWSCDSEKSILECNTRYCNCRVSAVNVRRWYLPGAQFMKPISQNRLIAKQTCILFSCSPSLTQSFHIS